MTEAQRQTVIDALELFQQYLQAYDWHDPDDYSNAVEALAIMRRARAPQPLRITIERVETNGAYSSDYRQD